MGEGQINFIYDIFLNDDLFRYWEQSSLLQGCLDLLLQEKRAGRSHPCQGLDASEVGHTLLRWEGQAKGLEDSTKND